MGKRLTVIRVKGECGLMDWGTFTYEEMVDKYRAHANELMRRAQAILDAEEYIVRIVEGKHRQELIQPLSPKDST